MVGVNEVGEDCVLVGHGYFGGLAVIVKLVLRCDANAAEAGHGSCLHLRQEHLLEIVYALQIPVCVEQGDLVRAKSEGNRIDEGVYQHFIPHVLALVYDFAICLADFEDFVAMIPNDVEKPIDLFLVFDLEVVPSAKERNIYFFFVFEGIVGVSEAMPLELNGDHSRLLIFVSGVGDARGCNLDPIFFLQLLRPIDLDPVNFTFSIELTILGLPKGLVEEPVIGHATGVLLGEAKTLSRVFIFSHVA